MSTYLVSQADRSNGRGTATVVREAIAGGIDAVQLREKHASAIDRYELGQNLYELTNEADIPLIVNDRVDLAVALDADGIHLGDGDLPIQVAREQLGEDTIVGRSVATPEAARMAEAAGADYLGVGAVFATGTKDTRPSESAIGVDTVAAVADVVSIPVVAIGGITSENAGRVAAAGADGVAVVTTITEADDPAAATRELHEAVEAGHEGATQ
ncbi:thiamine phosphate synthase [Halobaculum gomorrense]|uniref:thiamine phosphate synthase n=1 Tax=Halobaculum gomorrense TaxID=43928 RepID=UPI00190ED690|nr:thiamine phosphate synthase [Halobaculum gomorrense]